MKTFYAFLLTCFIATSLFAQTEMENVEEVPGFRSFTWGEHIDSMYTEDGQPARFLANERINGGNYYTIPGDDLVIGSILLRDILYAFSEKDKRFYKVILVGNKIDTETMEFIVDHKYGEHIDKDSNDDNVVKQWQVGAVTFTLKEFRYDTFELEIKSDWQMIEDYKKNTSVSDF